MTGFINGTTINFYSETSSTVGFLCLKFFKEVVDVEDFSGLAEAAGEVAFFDNFLDFLVFFTSDLELCQLHKGLKLSQKPTSARRLGNSQMPGRTMTAVMQNKKNVK